MRSKAIITISILLLLLIVACRKSDPNYLDNDEEWLSGGKQTVFDQSRSAFEHEFIGLSERDAFLHEVGDALFGATFVTSPAPINQGLGPIYNNTSCISCHQNDGRGRPPAPGQQPSSMLIRLSIDGVGAHGAPNPIPGFGGQFQTRAIAGKMPEGMVQINYTTINGQYVDGTPYTLRSPSYSLINTYAPLPANYMYSPRVAPAVFGLGLLEAIPDERIKNLADPFDNNNDSISGRYNVVYNYLTKGYDIGRFGWKAGQPNVRQQSADAFKEDMGITNFIFPTESSFNQPQYVPTNGYDVSDSLIYALGVYMQTLAVPARRNVNDPTVQEGKKIFNSIQCAACHTPSHTTAVDVTFPTRSNQKIFPYTDLLLHDMGSGLADNRPEYLANGREWRTPPLWGIGLVKRINGHEFFLHDGRAQNLTEAILWHGGEAENSKQKFIQLDAAQRQALIKFLESL